MPASVEPLRPIRLVPTPPSPSTSLIEEASYHPSVVDVSSKVTETTCELTSTSRLSPRFCSSFVGFRLNKKNELCFSNSSSLFITDLSFWTQASSHGLRFGLQLFPPTGPKLFPSSGPLFSPQASFASLFSPQSPSWSDLTVMSPAPESSPLLSGSSPLPSLSSALFHLSDCSSPFSPENSTPSAEIATPPASEGKDLSPTLLESVCASANLFGLELQGCRLKGTLAAVETCEKVSSRGSSSVHRTRKDLEWRRLDFNPEAIISGPRTSRSGRCDSSSPRYEF
ncbi:hypothetical protein LINPERPRIM_LOCUS39498 [Linum perenne]